MFSIIVTDNEIGLSRRLSGKYLLKIYVCIPGGTVKNDFRMKELEFSQSHLLKNRWMIKVLSDSKPKKYVLDTTT